MDASGSAIADAAVDVEVAAEGACDGAEDWTRPKRVTTDASGDYTAQLGLGNSRGPRCVRATEVSSGTTVQGEVEFVGGCDEDGPPGQLNLDLVIP